MKKSTNEILKLARKAIQEFCQNGKIIAPPKPLPKIFQKRAGIFVSLHQKNGDLRGCIGTFLPLRKNLAQEIIKNAISAATTDPRFPPLQAEELKETKISVDILSKPKSIKDLNKLNPKKYGLIIKSIDGRTGLLLPDIPGIFTPEQQIALCCQKGGINLTESVFFYRFSVQRTKE